jgi:peptidyl-prolyl cis-trans isomerase D
MAIIGKIRERSTLVLILIGGAIIAFVMTDLIGSGASFTQIRNVAEVDGIGIAAQDFQNQVQIATENFKANQPDQPVTDETRDAIRQQVYDQMLNQLVLDREFEELGLEVTTKELFDMVQGNNPHPQVRQAFTNPETGQFNPTDVVRFIQTLDQNPEGKSQWVNFEQALKSDREIQKYNTLVSKGLYATNFAAQQKNLATNRSLTVKYVLKRYNDISDTAISVTDGELKDYYNAHQDDYIQEASKKIEYVPFNIAPSEADIALVRKWANEMYQELKSTKNDSLFLVNNSDQGFDPKYYSKKTIPAGYDTTLFTQDIGFVTMPFEISTETRIQKLLDKKIGPDSVKAQHILVALQERSLEEANLIADSLLAEINAGQPFDSIAKNNSDDVASGQQGGDLGWFVEGTMVKPFNDAAFTSQIGEIKKIETQFGVHLIKVTEKTDDVLKIQVGALARTPEPGKETFASAFQDANGFSINASSSDWDNLINEKNLIRRAAIVNEDDRQVRGVEGSRSIVTWLADAEEGDISEPFDIKDAYVVAKLVEVNEDGVAPFEKVRARVEYEVKREKKAQQFIEQLNGSQNLADAASKIGGQVQDASNVSFDNPSLAGAGNEPEVVAKITTLSQGQMTATPIKGKNGVFMVQVTGVNEPGDATLGGMKSNIQTAYQSRVNNRQAINALKERASIVDNRSKFF